MSEKIEIKFKLTREDFITLQLFVASNTVGVQKRRKRSRWLISIIYILLGLFFISTDDITNLVIGISFFIFAIVWYFEYPVLTKYRYRKFYEKYVDENYYRMFDTERQITLTREYLLSEDDGGKSELKISEVEKVIELLELYLIRLKSSHIHVIPKEAVRDSAKFKKYFDDQSLEWDYQLNWRWK